MFSVCVLYYIYVCSFLCVPLDLPREDWERMKEMNNWHEVEVRDNRYNQIVHMVSAANGAEDFYTLAGHQTRHEGIEDARKIDDITANVS